MASTAPLPFGASVREPNSAAALNPADSAERISSIDVLRGFALLGIALMNIVFSGLPLAANWNPKVSGGATGPNLAAFFLQYVLFDGKMRGLFSMMFGASTLLLLNRLDARGAGIRAAEILYRRLLWLLVFGLVHAYLIWHGDILYPYALLGLVLFPLLRLRPRTLLIVAAVMLLLMTGNSIREGFHVRKIHDLAMEAEKAEAAQQKLSDEQKEAKREWEEKRKYFSPTADDLKKEHEQYSGSYFHLVAERAAIVKDWHSAAFYMDGWDMFTMMLVGIAFLKTGVLSAARKPGFYWRMLIVSYAIGLPIGSFSAWMSWVQGFEPMQTVFTFTTYQAARIAMTFGHMSVVLLLFKHGVFRALLSRLAAVGQTAFSNYIAHSLAYGLVFYGYGLNLFDKLERYQLYYVVLVLWTASLVLSPMWLRHYRFGPLEWAWRSLTYWKRQPMRVASEETLAATA